MRTNVPGTAQLGELVVAAFDAAAQYSTDPPEVSRLATRVVTHVLRRARRISHARGHALQLLLDEADAAHRTRWRCEVT